MQLKIKSNANHVAHATMQMFNVGLASGALSRGKSRVFSDSDYPELTGVSQRCALPPLY